MSAAGDGNEPGAGAGGVATTARASVPAGATEDVLSALAVMTVAQTCGVESEIAAIVWAPVRRPLQLFRGRPTERWETRDVQVSRYLGMGLELVPAVGPLVPVTGLAVSVGWSVTVKQSTGMMTVHCPDATTAVTVSYSARRGDEQAPTEAWLEALHARRVLGLLTGIVSFTDRGPDLDAARRSGGLLIGSAAYEPPGERA